MTGIGLTKPSADRAEAEPVQDDLPSDRVPQSILRSQRVFSSQRESKRENKLSRLTQCPTFMNFGLVESSVHQLPSVPVRRFTLNLPG
ncbi:hypothetical protein ANO14919_139530 [Xylariales sp. No.14919]|nr:hypothetical protein ANO14919_139530 [Xylariales sp. No.14919]